jgi:Tfp pilus assembly PilM family ATPase
MSSITVGLDIGSREIRGVWLRHSSQGIEVYHTACLEVASEGEPSVDRETLTARLREFLIQQRLTRATIVTAFPCREAFLRTLALPFRDPAKIEQVMPFEVESLLGVPLEDVMLDYQIVEDTTGTKSGEQGVSVLVAAIPRARFEAHRALYTAAGLAPVAIDLDGLALARWVDAYRLLNSTLPRSLAVLDLQAEGATLCCVVDGLPRLLRGFAVDWGLSSGMGFGHSHGQALSFLVQELRASLHSVEAQMRDRLTGILLVGHEGLCAHIRAELTQALGVPCIVVPDVESPCPPAFAMAYGLALHPAGHRSFLATRARVDRHSRRSINLIRAMAEATASSGISKRDGRLAGVLVGLLVVLLLTDIWLRVWLKEREVDEVDRVLRVEIAKQFSGMDAGGGDLDPLRARLAREKKALAVLGGTRPQVLSALATLVRQLPKETALRVRQLSIEPGLLQMEAETDTFEAVEKIKQALQHWPHVQEVIVGDARVGVGPHQVVFRVSAKWEGV